MAMTNFLAGGGDGYALLKGKIIEHQLTGMGRVKLLEQKKELKKEMSVFVSFLKASWMRMPLLSTWARSTPSPSGWNGASAF